MSRERPEGEEGGEKSRKMSTFSSQAKTSAKQDKTRDVQSSSDGLSPHAHGEHESTQTWMLRTIKLLSGIET